MLHSTGSHDILLTVRSLCPRAPSRSANNIFHGEQWRPKLNRTPFCTSTRRSYPQAHSAKKPKTGLNTPASGKQARWQERQQDYIVPGDLSATVEAHRRFNQRPSYYRDVFSENLTSAEPDDLHIIEKFATSSSTSKDRKGAPQAPGNKSKYEESRNGPWLLDEPATNLPSVLSSSTSIQAKRVDRKPPPPIDLPWETEESLSLSGRQRLNEEIHNFAKWAAPSAEEQRFRELVAIRECDKMRVLPGLHFEIVGSSRTGLATATSDVDIAFVIKLFQENEALRGPSTSLGRPLIRQAVRKKLYEIEKVLSESGNFENIEVIHKAYVPLLRARHRGAGIDLQFVYASDWPRDSELVRQYMEQYPQLLPTYLLIKNALKTRNLSIPQQRGLGSYPLLLLIVASFRIKKLSKSDDLVQSLSSFLRFCTMEFDAKKECLSIEPAMVFPKIPKGKRLSSDLKEEKRRNPAFSARIEMSYQDKENEDQLVIQDPNDFNNNAGRLCISFQRPKSAFWTFNLRLRHWLDQLRQDGKRKNKHPLEHMVLDAIAPIHESRMAVSNWLASDEGKAEMEAMENLNQDDSELILPQSIRTYDNVSTKM